MIVSDAAIGCGGIAAAAEWSMTASIRKPGGKSLPRFALILYESDISKFFCQSEL
jgi:hypothetical protein